LINKGIQQIKSEGFEEDEVFIEKMLDVRYRGQSFELTIPYQGNPEDKNEITQRFGQTHLKIYGYDRPGIDIEIVNLRVRATGFVSTPRLKRMELVDSNPIDSLIDFREVFLEHGKQGIPCYRGESLLPGNKIKGPAMVIRKDTTILFGESDTALVDQWGNLDINIGKQAKYQEEIL